MRIAIAAVDKDDGAEDDVEADKEDGAEDDD